MTKNPYLNSLAALVYITLVASVMRYASNSPVRPEDSVFGPVAFISLFSLSAAVMAYIFGYQPFMLYFDGKQKEAVQLFLRTVAGFGVLTITMLFLILAGII